ncbi:MAG: Eco47II family restriction endonuclease [Gallionella sp.]
MQDYNLGFISNIDLYNHVQATVLKYIENMKQTNIHRNLIDPIKLSFDGIVYQNTFGELMRIEAIRQVSESNNNQIGYFNQDIFRYIGTERGWSVPLRGGHGYDIENQRLNYFVEMKNKHNSMNSKSAQKTYEQMQEVVDSNCNATCLLVEVIAKHSQNISWHNNPRIRRISIDKFYALVTERPFAFRELCDQLPNVIIDVFRDIYPTASLLTEESHLRDVYYQTFRQYDGFHP